MVPFPRPILFVACALFAAPALFAQDSAFRAPKAAKDTTIFTPLDLPAPNRVRNGAGAPGADYWQQQVDYEIEASLDPETRVVRGKAHVTYHNESPDALDYLWLNLEQNAFRADSIAAGVGTRTAVGMRRAEGDGYIIHKISHKGRILKLSVYDTLGRVDLPKAIPPRGGVFEFDIEWEFTIPQHVFRRFGIRKAKQGAVYEVAQWFPAVAVYDDVHGWNTMPYIGSGEFYSNFGTYDVEITVPHKMLVVATGELQNPKSVYTNQQIARLKKARKSKKTVAIRAADEVASSSSRPPGKNPLTWRFHAERVRTFAWAASESFILDATGVDGILVQAAYPAESLPVWGKAAQMLRTAIAGYNERWHPYPYTVATTVSGAEGGMEYPMIVFCRGRNERGLYGVITHEIGHNWFPMMVNSDERRHAWMDEGFNTFINNYSTADWFGPDARKESDPASFAPMMMFPNQVPIDTPPDQLDGMMLGTLEYAKTGVGLVLLRESILGPDRFDYAFRKYIQRWAFKSPQPADFFRCMDDAAGEDLDWFWRGWFYGTGYLDQAVDGVQQPHDGKPGKVFFKNLGELVMPLRFHVEFADGSEKDYRLPVEIWFHSNQSTEVIPGDSDIVSVEIDADREFPDVDRGNNRWTPAIAAKSASGKERAKSKG